MILTAHLVVGAAIASKISNPALGLSLAFLSHYFLDPLPHQDYSFETIKRKQWNRTFFDFTKIFLDILLGMFIILLFSANKPAIFAGSFFAVIPDGITLLSIIFSENKLFAQHQRLHRVLNGIGDAEANKRIPVLLGILVEIATIVIAIFFLQ